MALTVVVPVSEVLHVSESVVQAGQDAPWQVASLAGVNAEGVAAGGGQLGPLLQRQTQRPVD